MSRSWKALLILLSVQAALSAAAVVADWSRSCAACLAWGMVPGVAGAVFYAGLLVLALTRGPSRLLFGSILFGFGVHAALTLQMALSGIFCGLCLGAAVGSISLVALAIAIDPHNVGRLGIAVPWSVLLIAAASSVLRSSNQGSGTSAGSVNIVIFTQEDCAYCEELRDRVIPEIEKEFGGRVRIGYRPASDLPAVRKTPTLILTPGRAGVQGRVIEGLPTVERLRGAIHDLETRS